MKKYWMSSVLAVLSVYPFFTSAERDFSEETGAQLLKDCRPVIEGRDALKDELPSSLLCVGFMRGMLEMNINILGEEKREFCVPNGTTLGDATRAMSAKLEELPNLQDWSYATAAVLALKYSYPCSRD